MADKDFVVKNGLVVDTSTLVVNATSNRVGINNTNPDASLTVTGTANVSGDVTLMSTVTLPGTLVVSTISANGTVGSNGQALISDGTAVYWGNVATGGSAGGYYKGNAGTVGDVGNLGNLYRVNSNTQSNNITIASGENALTVGPMVIATGYNLTISEGGRAVII